MTARPQPSPRFLPRFSARSMVLALVYFSQIPFGNRPVAPPDHRRVAAQQRWVAFVPHGTPPAPNTATTPRRRSSGATHTMRQTPCGIKSSTEFRGPDASQAADIGVRRQIVDLGCKIRTVRTRGGGARPADAATRPVRRQPGSGHGTRGLHNLVSAPLLSVTDLAIRPGLVRKVSRRHMAKHGEHSRSTPGYDDASRCEAGSVLDSVLVRPYVASLGDERTDEQPIGEHVIPNHRRLGRRSKISVSAGRHRGNRL